MKYLQQTQSYSDYRGLKKKIRKDKDGPSTSESRIGLAEPPEPAHFAGEQAEAPSTSRARHDIAMGLGELPIRRKSTFSKKTSHDPDASLSSTHSNRPLSNMKKSKDQTSRGILARANSAFRTSSASISLRELIPILSPQDSAFVDALDREVEKIETFYDARKREMETRTKVIKAQLTELEVHHQRFHEAQARNVNHNPLTSALHFTSKLMAHGPALVPSSSSGSENEEDSSMSKSKRELADTEQRGEPSRNSLDQRPSAGRDDLNPEDYENAKKKLQKAVIEHYRSAVVVLMWTGDASKLSGKPQTQSTILNITGFRKALKKFEKLTRVPLQYAYMTERVEPSSFASDKTLRGILDEMEGLYTDHFAHGDKKRAKTRLKTGRVSKTHHYSTFRSGLFLGAGIPALVAGIVASFQPETRAQIPNWDGLLFAYGVISIPVFFSLLVGVNLLVWKLDPRTRLDHREYFEIPSLLFVTLSYAFWLSFSLIGAPSISPDVWPLVWLGFTVVIMLDPFNVFFKSSRFWLVKSVLKLLVPGMRRVEFTDFWMGLIFTLADLYVFACSYARGFDNWRKCGSTSKAWPAAFALAMLPLLIRVIQSGKRYFDSRLGTHLINGGKYLSGIIYYLTYYVWRHQGMIHTSVSGLSLTLPLGSIHNKSFVICQPEMYIQLFLVGFIEMLRRWQWNFFRLENEHLGNMDQYRVTREVPLPYSFDEEEGRTGDTTDEDS
ncbi:hypothetical protein D9757_013185 [Collybiopsis confluens]|uniref:Uncharacterized protein n=1 Tax=Collybiopsis confluens TaxID=2823264 RepID=A0A8H5D4T5_9AGAR|nr:hypothetical protein D9757_013185 [Collybiopsis confluens]